MNINKKQMDEINAIQLNIFKEFIKVCDSLNLDYFLIHGSLLGAIKYNNFFPYDDDIDVAMPRKDFDIFIEKGQKMLSNNLFIQSYKTEKEYPLEFAKVRDSNTTFIQPILEGLNVNKGIYIDVFPIDNYPTNKIIILKTKILKKMYKIRISSMFKEKKSFPKKLSFLIVRLLLPNRNKTLKKLNNLYSKIPQTGKIIIFGGKHLEMGINAEFFEGKKLILFNDVDACIPNKATEYLNTIYGNYKTYSPSEKLMRDKDLVEISANIVDTKKSYVEYENKR